MRQAEGLDRRGDGLSRNSRGCSARFTAGARRIGNLPGEVRSHGMRAGGTPRLGELRAMAVEFPVVQIQTQLLRAGILTVDEVRVMRGLGKMASLPVVADTEVTL